MQFTPQEMKLIERLRKQARQWHWVRWGLLGMGLFTFACNGYIGVSVCRLFHWEALTTEDAFMAAIYWPEILAATSFATWCCVWPLANWHGDASRMLVLRLLDEQNRKTVDEDAS